MMVKDWPLTAEALQTARKGYEALLIEADKAGKGGLVADHNSLVAFLWQLPDTTSRFQAQKAARLLIGSGLVTSKQGSRGKGVTDVTVVDMSRRNVTVTDISNLYSKADESEIEERTSENKLVDAIHGTERVVEATVADVIIPNVSEQVLPSSDEQGFQVPTFDVLDPPSVTTLPLPSDDEPAPATKVRTVTLPSAEVDHLITQATHWKQEADNRRRDLKAAFEKRGELEEEIGNLQDANGKLQSDNDALREDKRVLEEALANRQQVDDEQTERLRAALKDLDMN